MTKTPVVHNFQGDRSRHHSEPGPQARAYAALARLGGVLFGGDHGRAKQFFLLQGTHDDLFNEVEGRPRYEFVQVDKPVKLFCDLDLSREDKDDAIRKMDDFEATVIDVMTRAVKTRFGLDVAADKVFRLTADGANGTGFKASRHLIFDDVWFANNEFHLKSFIKTDIKPALVKWLEHRDLRSDVFDTSVYNKNSHFRFCFCHKEGSTRTLRPSEGQGIMTKEAAFMRSLVQPPVPGGVEPLVMPTTVLNTTRCNISRPKPKSVSMDVASQPDEFKKLEAHIRAVTCFNNPTITDISRVRTDRGEMINVKTRGSHCLRARRTHKSNNVWFCVNTWGITQYCHDPECKGRPVPRPWDVPNPPFLDALFRKTKTAPEMTSHKAPTTTEIVASPSPEVPPNVTEMLEECIVRDCNGATHASQDVFFKVPQNRWIEVTTAVSKGFAGGNTHDAMLRYHYVGRRRALEIMIAGWDDDDAEVNTANALVVVQAVYNQVNPPSRLAVVRPGVVNNGGSVGKHVTIIHFPSVTVDDEMHRALLHRVHCNEAVKKAGLVVSNMFEGTPCVFTSGGFFMDAEGILNMSDAVHDNAIDQSMLIPLATQVSDLCEWHGPMAPSDSVINGIEDTFLIKTSGASTLECHLQPTEVVCVLGILARCGIHARALQSASYACDKSLSVHVPQGQVLIRACVESGTLVADVMKAGYRIGSLTTPEIHMLFKTYADGYGKFVTPHYNTDAKSFKEALRDVAARDTTLGIFRMKTLTRKQKMKTLKVASLDTSIASNVLVQRPLGCVLYRYNYKTKKAGFHKISPTSYMHVGGELKSPGKILSARVLNQDEISGVFGEVLRTVYPDAKECASFIEAMHEMITSLNACVEEHQPKFRPVGVLNIEHQTVTYHHKNVPVWSAGVLRAAALQLVNKRDDTNCENTKKCIISLRKLSMRLPKEYKQSTMLQKSETCKETRAAISVYLSFGRIPATVEVTDESGFKIIEQEWRGCLGPDATIKVFNRPETVTRAAMDSVNIGYRLLKAKRSTVALKAQMGAGKTKALNELSGLLGRRTKFTFLSICPLRSLCRGQQGKWPSIKLGFSDGNKTVHKVFHDAKALATCLDSLLKTIDPKTGRIRHFDFIFLDEFEGLLSHFGSSTMATRSPSTIMNVLEQLVSTATVVVVADAYLSTDLSGRFLRRVRESATFDMQINTWRRPLHVNVVQLHGKKAIRSRIRGIMQYNAQQRQDGRTENIIRWACVSNEAGLVSGLQQDYLSICTEHKHDTTRCKFLWAKDSDDEGQDSDEKYKRHPNKHVVNLDGIAFSPTITSGWSFERRHFHVQFAWYGIRSTSSLNSIQMWRRIRQLTRHPVHAPDKDPLSFVAMEPGRSSVTLQSECEVRDNLLRRCKATLDTIKRQALWIDNVGRCNATGQMTTSDAATADYVAMFSVIKCRRDLDTRCFHVHILNHIRDMGLSISTPTTTWLNRITAATVKPVKFSKESVERVKRRELVKAVVKAPVLSEDEYTSLRSYIDDGVKRQLSVCLADKAKERRYILERDCAPVLNSGSGTLSIDMVASIDDARRHNKKMKYALKNLEKNFDPEDKHFSPGKHLRWPYFQVIVGSVLSWVPTVLKSPKRCLFFDAFYCPWLPMFQDS